MNVDAHKSDASRLEVQKVNPQKVGEAYDGITGLWQRESFDRENGIAQHRRALGFVTQKGRALDVGCGCTGRFIDLLLSEGFTVEGVDVSAEMLNLARQRHPQVDFHHVDICEWAVNGTYDFITAWDSIWHVPVHKQAALLTKLVASLNSGGVLIFSFGGTDSPDQHVDSSMGPELYYGTLGTSGFLELLQRLPCVCRHLEYDQFPELHAYLIVQKV